jgi:hypothetical protein
MLEGFGEQVLKPWQDALANAGFIWTRCYPILFVSGAGCMTKYHMDYSHVVAWQIAGTKTFSGFKEPDRWTTLEQRVHRHGVQLPEGVRDEDVLAYEMPPGSVLWNCMLTPHWVAAGNEPSYSLNISHGGVSRNGQFSPHEQEIIQWRIDHPEESQIGIINSTY